LLGEIHEGGGRLDANPQKKGRPSFLDAARGKEVSTENLRETSGRVRGRYLKIKYEPELTELFHCVGEGRKRGGEHQKKVCALSRIGGNSKSQVL